MKTIYKQMPDKFFFQLQKFFKIECCDCSLVHTVKFKNKKGVLGFEVSRDNRATAQRRRWKKKNG